MRHYLEEYTNTFIWLIIVCVTLWTYVAFKMDKDFVIAALSALGVATQQRNRTVQENQIKNSTVNQGDLSGSDTGKNT